MTTKKRLIAKLIVERLNRMKMNNKATWKLWTNKSWDEVNEPIIWASYNRGGNNTFVLDGFINLLPTLIQNPACCFHIIKTQYTVGDHPHIDLIKDFMTDPTEYMELMKS
jgi:uncharacterized membrane protein